MDTYKDSPIAKRLDATIEEFERDRDQIDWVIAELRKTVAQLTNGQAEVESDAKALLRDRILSRLDGRAQRPTDITEALDMQGRVPEVEAALEDLYNEGLVNKRERGWWELVEKPANESAVEA